MFLVEDNNPSRISLFPLSKIFPTKSLFESEGHLQRIENCLVRDPQSENIFSDLVVAASKVTHCEVDQCIGSTGAEYFPLNVRMPHTDHERSLIEALVMQSVRQITTYGYTLNLHPSNLLIGINDIKLLDTETRVTLNSQGTGKEIRCDPAAYTMLCLDPYLSYQAYLELTQLLSLEGELKDFFGIRSAERRHRYSRAGLTSTKDAPQWPLGEFRTRIRAIHRSASTMPGVIAAGIYGSVANNKSLVRDIDWMLVVNEDRFLKAYKALRANAEKQGSWYKKADFPMEEIINIFPDWKDTLNPLIHLNCPSTSMILPATRSQRIDEAIRWMIRTEYSRNFVYRIMAKTREGVWHENQEPPYIKQRISFELREFVAYETVLEGARRDAILEKYQKIIAQHR